MRRNALHNERGDDEDEEGAEDEEDHEYERMGRASLHVLVDCSSTWGRGGRHEQGVHANSPNNATGVVGSIQNGNLMEDMVGSFLLRQIRA